SRACSIFERVFTATFAPPAARQSEIALPMLRAAPVTSATFPASLSPLCMPASVIFPAFRRLREALGIVFGIEHVDRGLAFGRFVHALADFGGEAVVALHRRTRFHRFEPAHEMGVTGLVDAAVLVAFGPRVDRHV